MTTGIVGGIILVFAIFVNEWVARCAVTLILFLCMHEMIHALAGDQDAPLHVWVPYAFAFLLLPAVTFFSMQGGFILLTICVLIQFMLVVLLDKPGRLGPSLTVSGLLSTSTLRSREYEFEAEIGLDDHKLVSLPIL